MVMCTVVFHSSASCKLKVWCQHFDVDDKVVLRKLIECMRYLLFCCFGLEPLVCLVWNL